MGDVQTFSTGPGDFIVTLQPGSGKATVVDLGSDIQKNRLRRVALNNGSVEIQTDAGGLFAVFGDLGAGVVSSSLRAVVASGRRCYGVNRDALCEQLVTGAVVGRETIFEGVERLDGAGELVVAGTRVFLHRSSLATSELPARFSNRQSCRDFQLEVLRRYFQQIRGVAGERGVSIGLSGGYDSRLMLLLCLDAGISVHPFTFASAAHEKELAVASEVAQQSGVVLRAVPVRPMDQLDAASLEANIEDSLAYYDGRTNETMGTFGDVHTARIQRTCMGDAALHLNGLGGELYRNRERLPSHTFDFREWFWYYVVRPEAWSAFVSEKERRHFEERLASKYGTLLGVGRLRRLDRGLARRWYRDIWLPFSAGPRLSAENRVGPALMPFAEGSVSAAALAATPFIGPHGDFEAAMIRRLNEKVASVPSSYGPGFGSSPWHRRMLEGITALVSVWARRARHRSLRFRQRSTAETPGWWYERFEKPIGFLKVLKLPLDIDRLLEDQVSRDRTLYVAEFLYRHCDHLCI